LATNHVFPPFRLPICDSFFLACSLCSYRPGRLVLPSTSATLPAGMVRKFRSLPLPSRPQKLLFQVSPTHFLHCKPGPCFPLVLARKMVSPIFFSFSCFFDQANSISRCSSPLFSFLPSGESIFYPWISGAFLFQLSISFLLSFFFLPLVFFRVLPLPFSHDRYGSPYDIEIGVIPFLSTFFVPLLECLCSPPVPKFESPLFFSLLLGSGFCPLDDPATAFFSFSRPCTGLLQPSPFLISLFTQADQVSSRRHHDFPCRLSFALYCCFNFSFFFLYPLLKPPPSIILLEPHLLDSFSLPFLRSPSLYAKIYSGDDLAFPSPPWCPACIFLFPLFDTALHPLYWKPNASTDMRPPSPQKLP